MLYNRLSLALRDVKADVLVQLSKAYMLFSTKYELPLAIRGAFGYSIIFSGYHALSHYHCRNDTIAKRYVGVG